MEAYLIGGKNHVQRNDDSRCDGNRKCTRRVTATCSADDNIPQKRVKVLVLAIQSDADVQCRGNTACHDPQCTNPTSLTNRIEIQGGPAHTVFDPLNDDVVYECCIR